MNKLPAILSILLTALTAHAAEPLRLENDKLALRFDAASGATQVTGLRCEYLMNPLGVDVHKPRLSWIIEAKRPGQRQTAYRIKVASTKALLASDAPDLWDSGKVLSDESAQVHYGGKDLASRQRCWWQVQVWDKEDTPAGFSQPAWWEMGLLSPADWRARWITGAVAAPLFRREFSVEKPVRAARLYVCGLGVYEAFLNGRGVGNQPLAPLLSYYPKRAYYDTYDVTALVRPGRNVIGAWLAPGWFGDPEMGHDMGAKGKAWRRNPTETPAPPDPRVALLAQLHLDYDDGRTEIIGTGGDWKTAASGLQPIAVQRHYCFGFQGEVFDGTAHPAGWDLAGFDDSAWAGARVLASPTAQLSARPMQPNGIVEEVEPANRRALAVANANPAALVAAMLDAGVRNWGSTGTVPFFRERFAQQVAAGVARLAGVPLRQAFEVDFGRHVSGWVELKVTGAPGDWVGVFGLDWHRLRGTPGETVRLHFLHRAFRYVPVLLFGSEQAPHLNSVRAVGLQNVIPASGRFACSDPELNRIHDAAARTWRSLMLSGMPMDSWQERFGTALPQNFEPALYWQEAGAFYTKWLQDMADARRPDGYIPTTGGPVAMDYWSANWGQCAPVMVPWLMWQYYGDLQAVRTMYPVARDWLKFSEPPANDLDKTWKPPADHGHSERGVGDHGRFTARWYDARGGELIETLFIIRFFQMAEDLARVLGEREDAERYAGFVKRLTAKVNRPEFFDAARGLYAGGDQGCHATALMAGVVPEDARPKVERELFRDILETRGGHMNTGFFGTWFLLKLLDERNRPEVAHRIIAADSAPSWRTLLRHPASPEPLTVLPEFFTGGMIPHPGWCSVGLWFYQSLAGIHPDPAAPGFRRVIIRPRVPPGLRWVEADYNSIRGPIATRWRQENGRFTLTVTVPPNVTARVCVPAADPKQVHAPAGAVVSAHREPGCAVFEMCGGTCRFD